MSACLKNLRRRAQPFDTKAMIFLLLTLLALPSSSHSRQITTANDAEDRLAVVDNKISPNEFVFAFHAQGGKLRFQKYSMGKWSAW